MGKTIKINDKFHIYAGPVSRENREYMVELYENDVLVVCDLVTVHNLESKISLYESDYLKYSERRKKK